ncbi:MAG: sigma-70 family RNA polymerase sigma factor [Nitrospinae bacterium]|nr:sigma-70 family RNA polymerase sigma factor [Nitrospinota bacterium]
MKKSAEQMMLAGLRARDHDAFETFITEYKPMVHYVCRKYFKGRFEIEDMAQNVFLKVYEKIDGFQGNSKLSSWLYRVAVNECLMSIRKESKIGMVAEKYHEIYPGPSREDNPLIYVANKIILESLLESIGGLGDKEKKTMFLCLVEEKSNQDSAALLGTSIAAIKSRLNRARARLRKSKCHLIKDDLVPRVRRFIG